MNDEQKPSHRRVKHLLERCDALAAQPTFAQGLVYAPVKDWSQMVIDEMELFPKGRYDDLTDSTTMAVSFLRSSGIHRPTPRRWRPRQIP